MAEKQGASKSVSSFSSLGRSLKNTAIDLGVSQSARPRETKKNDDQRVTVNLAAHGDAREARETRAAEQGRREGSL